MESALEALLVGEIKKMGGWAVKFFSPGTTKMPDRLVLFRGHGWFVELKDQGKKPGKGQKGMHRRLQRIGWPVLVLNSRIKIMEFIYAIQTLQLSEQCNATYSAE